MTNPYWKSDTYALIQMMKLAGNQQGVISRWVDQTRWWAERNAGSDADAIQAWLPYWQDRPFYTAAELAPMIPALCLSLGITDRWKTPKSATRVRNELRYGLLPRLENANGTLIFDGKEYFIVERVHYWKTQRLTRRQFDEILRPERYDESRADNGPRDSLVAGARTSR